MTVHADNGVLAVGHSIQNVRNERAKLFGDGIANRIRYVDGRRSCGNGRFNHVVEKARVRTRRIHWRKLDAVAKALGQFDGTDSHF